MTGITFYEVCEKLPTSSKRYKAIAKDPAACARYFDRITKVFISEASGWDIEAGRSKKGGGLYGLFMVA